MVKETPNRLSVSYHPDFLTGRILINVVVTHPETVRSSGVFMGENGVSIPAEYIGDDIILTRALTALNNSISSWKVEPVTCEQVRGLL